MTKTELISRLEQLQKEMGAGPFTEVLPEEIGKFYIVPELSFSVETEGTSQLIHWIVEELEKMIDE